jgi:hypothetical protein
VKPPVPGPLPLPIDQFHDLELPIVESSNPWFRSHSIDHGPIFYGRNARFRFDHPLREYRVLYVAEDAFGAFVETFGQFISIPSLPRRITSEELLIRALSEIVADRPVRLVDLTGPGLARIGADARLFAGNYNESQVWSSALHSHPSRIDGLLYPTRHDPRRKAAAIFTELIGWAHLSRRTWLSLGLELRNILSEYNFSLIESQTVPLATRKGPKQEELF